MAVPVRILVLVVALLATLTPAGTAAGRSSARRSHPAADDRTPVTVELSIKPATSVFGTVGRKVIATVTPVPDGGSVRIRGRSEADVEVYDSGVLAIDPETGIARDLDVSDGIPPGTNTLVATFSGTPYFAPATSDPATLTVTHIPTTVELRVTDAHVAEGAPLEVFVVADTPSRAPALLLVDGEPLESTFGQKAPGFQMDGLVLPPGRHVLKVRFLGNDDKGIGPSVSDPVEVVVGSVRGPEDGIAIEAGHATTGTRDVSVGIGLASGDRSVKQVRLSSTATLDAGLLQDGTTFAEAPAIDWTLPAGDDGQRTVYAQFQYADDSWSSVVSDDIYLDRTAPEGTIAINEGDEQMGDAWPNRGIDEPTFRSRVWDEALDWGGRIAAVGYTYDGDRWFYRQAFGSSWPAGFLTYFDPLTSAPDKPITITLTARFRDSAGNWSDPATDTIDLVWRTPVARFSFDGEPQTDLMYTDQEQITLTIHTQVIPPEGVETIHVGGCSGARDRYAWRKDRDVELDLSEARFSPFPDPHPLREICVKLTSTTGRERSFLLRLLVDRVLPLADSPVPAFALDAEVAPSAVAADQASTRTVIAWDGRDDRKVAGFRAQRSVDAAGWTSIQLPRPSARSVTQPVTSGAGYRFRVRAVDAAGNAGGWKTGAAFRMEVIPDDSPRITYAGTWVTADVPEALGGSLHQTGQRGASARFTFTGRALAWIAPKTENGDLVDVYIDGRLAKRVNLALSTGVHQRRVVLSVAWARFGSHTVKLVHRYAGHKLPVDGFLVLR